MDLEGALHIAELIRQDVENHPVSVDGREAVHVSVSIGLSALLPDGDHSPAQLISLADEALYRAKRAGRNCVRAAAAAQCVAAA